MYYATQDGTEISEDFAEIIIDEIHDELDELEDKIEKSASNKTSFGKNEKKMMINLIFNKILKQEII